MDNFIFDTEKYYRLKTESDAAYDAYCSASEDYRHERDEYQKMRRNFERNFSPVNKVYASVYDNLTRIQNMDATDRTGVNAAMDTILTLAEDGGQYKKWLRQLLVQLQTVKNAEARVSQTLKKRDQYAFMQSEEVKALAAKHLGLLVATQAEFGEVS